MSSMMARQTERRPGWPILTSRHDIGKMTAGQLALTFRTSLAVKVRIEELRRIPYQERLVLLPKPPQVRDEFHLVERLLAGDDLLFEQIVTSIAVLAFDQGGVEFMGLVWCEY